MLTGESVPFERKESDEVIGGSINGDSSLEMRVDQTGEDSYLSKVINLVEKAQKAKSNTQRFADKAALVLTIIAISVGVTTLIVWLSLGESFNFAISRMATVMVITCPHALGLAIPLVVAVSTSMSAKNGILIRNRTAFEGSRNISTVLFDKTGTLTHGEFGVSEIKILSEEFEENRVVQLAASLEQNSEHPIGKGIVAYAKEKGIELENPGDFEAVKGKGVKGRVDDVSVQVASPNYVEEMELKLPGIDQKEIAGETRVYLVVDESRVAGMISLADKIREESHEAIKRLKDAGIKAWMVTGDNEAVAKKVSNDLGLDGYYAEVLPDEKQEKVKDLQAKGEYVAMTGDGINDAPALAQADVGIAIGSGTDVAAETADIILVNSNPKDVSALILFGEATYSKMVQNLLWATGYNVIAIPLAAGVLFNLGIVISPAIGAILMSLSTVIVAINARLLDVKK